MNHFLRKKIRNSILDIVSKSNNIPFFSDFFKKPRIQFLYIHHVFNNEIENLKLLIQELSIHHTFISYSEAITRINNNNIDKPYIVFSSDDGFKNNLIFAEILSRYGISACFFVNPFVIGEKNPQLIANYCHSKLNSDPVDFLDWKDIEFLQKNNHEIGSHTMDHFRISKVSNFEIIDDFNQTFKILSSKCGYVKHFAYPYGRFKDFTDIAKKMCFQVGYESCATAERGIHMQSELDFTEIVNPIILRDHIVLEWPLSHSMFFILKNSVLKKTISFDFKFQ